MKSLEIGGRISQLLPLNVNSNNFPVMWRKIKLIRPKKKKNI